ncbi:polycystic kidney disease protein 1-like 1 [Tupaia chinensis]|uniref:polycystic kidney disease protein 1-like 1 n=1 Tax=Tupaia chinensis TaxID=246437 RepID=UPI000FFB3F2F|nr:polycystic kidney disease protein 1-like 1 [Tupaia chinensis]
MVLPKSVMEAPTAIFSKNAFPRSVEQHYHPGYGVLAARLRARHLRLVHPPSTDELKDTRARLRRENRTQAALRDISLHILTLLLFSFIIYGTYPREEYSLNQAIRKEFTRNGRNPLGAVRSVEEWWDWSLTTLLDGLYPGGTLAAQEPRAQAGALGGKCYQIGSLVIEQLKVSPSSECKPPRMSSGLTGDALPACSSKVGDFEHSYEIFPENQNVTLCGPEGCGVRANCVRSLGRTRREAHAALSSLRTRRWINHSTRAVSVHFTLYNPPTRLFTRLTLSVEILPTGSLVPSSLVESFSIFHSNTPLRYYLILSQLAFLVLNLAHLWFQLYNLIEKGGLNYWRKPRNWLELSVAGVGLTYHAACGHLATLAGGIADQFRQGLCQASLDLSLVATWNQDPKLCKEAGVNAA